MAEPQTISDHGAAHFPRRSCFGHGLPPSSYQAIGLIRLGGIARELSELLGGREVDLRTEGNLSSYFRDEVFRAAEIPYAA